MFTNAAGGIDDDLMFANYGDHLFVVVNASRKTQDIAHMTARLGDVCEVIPIHDRALIALQGPKAEAALEAVVPGVASMKFMDVVKLRWKNSELWISRSGYTGEDGFEVSVPVDCAVDLADALIADTNVQPIGLGARNSPAA